MSTVNTIHDQMKLIRDHQKSAPVHVVPIAKELGLDVYKASGWPSDLSGMIKKTTDGDYDIFVNATHHEHRRRFTIAHELAHYILHKDAIGNGVADDALYRSSLSNTVEAEANRLAADILMPWHLLDPIISMGITDIERLASLFWVSNSAMSIRLGVPYEDGHSDSLSSVTSSGVAACL